MDVTISENKRKLVKELLQFTYESLIAVHQVGFIYPDSFERKYRIPSMKNDTEWDKQQETQVVEINTQDTKKVLRMLKGRLVQELILEEIVGTVFCREFL